MTPIVWTYIVYIALSIPLTIWVAQTLHKNGRVFLIDSFRGNERLADSVNHLLVVGFYLINIGYVALALKERIAPTDVRALALTFRRRIALLFSRHLESGPVFHPLQPDTGPPTTATAPTRIRCFTVSLKTRIPSAWAMTIILPAPPCT